MKKFHLKQRSNLFGFEESHQEVINEVHQRKNDWYPTCHSHLLIQLIPKKEERIGEGNEKPFRFFLFCANKFPIGSKKQKTNKKRKENFLMVFFGHFDYQLAVNLPILIF